MDAYRLLPARRQASPGRLDQQITNTTHYEDEISV